MPVHQPLNYDSPCTSGTPLWCPVLGRPPKSCAVRIRLGVDRQHLSIGERAVLGSWFVINPLSMAPPLIVRCYRLTANGIQIKWLGWSARRGTPDRSTTCAVIRGNGGTGFCMRVVAQWLVHWHSSHQCWVQLLGRKPVFLIPSYLLSACLSWPSISMSEVVSPLLIFPSRLSSIFVELTINARNSISWLGLSSDRGWLIGK